MPRALISVYDKTDIVEFAQELIKLDFEIISTGGTYQALTDAGLEVKYITDVTGFPEILDGRVKTLHPKIHGGILARDTDEHQAELKLVGCEFIDLVVVNLYPFRATITKPGATFQDAIENIDIGGPTMVRAAAKNHERVSVVVNPARYREIIAALKEQGSVPRQLRSHLATEAFAHTAAYDMEIASYLEKGGEGETLSEDVETPATLRLAVPKSQELRYGENPGQAAALYKDPQAISGTLAGGTQLHGKELSYNNWVDMDAAWSITKEFTEPVCAIIKHTNSCGLAIGQDLSEAYEKALASDPLSAYGGIVAVNRTVDAQTGQALAKHFFEVIIAPKFSEEALKILTAKKNLRLFEVDDAQDQDESLGKITSIDGGFLYQKMDRGLTPVAEWTVVTKAQPTESDLRELEFAWKGVKHVKSNAILVSRAGQAIGVGAGQMNRVGAAKIAFSQAGEKANGAYLASDAFFPFPDTVEEAAKHGIRAIVQPGGSIRDNEAIAACDKLGLIMLFTGRRHFKH